MLSDCNANSSYAAKRYVKDGDTAVVLLFDINGYIAGIQARFPSQRGNSYPYPPLQNHPFVLSEGKEYITAYFVDPRQICTVGRTEEMFEESGTGTDLYIQNGTDLSQTVRIPKTETDLVSTKCFPTMGMHYWYNVRKDMDCDEYYPVFLLYNGGKLNAFGWAFNANLNSTRYEHPPKSSFEIISDLPNGLVSERIVAEFPEPCSRLSGTPGNSVDNAHLLDIKAILESLLIT